MIILIVKAESSWNPLIGSLSLFFFYIIFTTFSNSDIVALLPLLDRVIF